MIIKRWRCLGVGQDAVMGQITGSQRRLLAHFLGAKKAIIYYEETSRRSAAPTDFGLHGLRNRYLQKVRKTRS